MISLTYDELEKVQLLDKLFGSFTVEDLKDLADTEQIVSRLKGSESNSKLLERLVNDNATLSVDLMNIRNETMSLKSDIQSLIKALNSSLYGYNQEFNNLKQKHNVY